MNRTVVLKVTHVSHRGCRYHRIDAIYMMMRGRWHKGKDKYQWLKHQANYTFEYCNLLHIKFGIYIYTHNCWGNMWRKFCTRLEALVRYWGCWSPFFVATFFFFTRLWSLICWACMYMIILTCSIVHPHVHPMQKKKL